MKNDWKTEIIRKLPWSATFLVASYCFFKYTNQEIVAWICFIVAIIALFLVIRFEYYEKIIDRQEKQIIQYSKKALDSHSESIKTMAEVSTSFASNFSSKYKKESDSSTDVT